MRFDTREIRNLPAADVRAETRVARGMAIGLLKDGCGCQAGNQQPAARPGISCGLSETREHVQEQAQLIADECMASLNGGGYSSPLKSPRCVTRLHGGWRSNPGIVSVIPGSWRECGEQTDLARGLLRAGSTAVAGERPQSPSRPHCKHSSTASACQPAPANGSCANERALFSPR